MQSTFGSVEKVTFHYLWRKNSTVIIPENEIKNKRYYNLLKTYFRKQVFGVV